MKKKRGKLKPQNRNIIKEFESIPHHLYKYSGLSGKREKWVKNIILESKVYFPSQKELNDPFDCKIPVKFKANDLKARSYWSKVIRRDNPDMSQSELIRTVKKLLCDSKTVDGKKNLNNQLFKSIAKSGVGSFTKNPINILMWSYYAEGHSGVALRFNMSPENLLKINVSIIPLEVDCPEKQPELNYYDIAGDREHFLATELGTKFKGWEHEEEWRLISVLQSGELELPYEMLDGIILGVQIEEKEEELIREWVKERGLNIEILRASRVDNSFELELTNANQ